VQAVVQTDVEHAEQQCLRYPKGKKIFQKRRGSCLRLSVAEVAARNIPRREWDE
jgi:hypothetical protein